MYWIINLEVIIIRFVSKIILSGQWPTIFLKPVVNCEVRTLITKYYMIINTFLFLFHAYYISYTIHFTEI